MKDYFMKDQPIRFVFPIDGDCINDRDGAPIDGGVRITVKVEAPEGADMYLGGEKMQYRDGLFFGEADVCGFRNTLVANDASSGMQAKIVVLYLQQTVGYFRISSDDNIRFLQDINDHKDEYKSIFDNPYLAVYKKAHDLYGAKIHLNLFYEFEDAARKMFSKERAYFNLSMMTDKFKDEFTANSDWLKLAFHSKGETPACPYEFAEAKTIMDDCIAVHREIVRFAGEKCISNSTTVHFGRANHECMRALRSMGYRSFTGYFTLGKDGRPSVSYYAPAELVKYVTKRDFWYDSEEDILFARIDRVTNLGTLDECMAAVKDTVSDPHRGGFVSIMIHEQYFYSDYKRYLPDFEARVLEPCKYLYEHGYIGAHISDITRESDLRNYAAFHKQ